MDNVAVGGARVRANTDLTPTICWLWPHPHRHRTPTRLIAPATKRTRRSDLPLYLPLFFLKTNRRWRTDPHAVRAALGGIS